MRLGVIGLGEIGVVHVDGARSVAALTAVSDKDENLLRPFRVTSVEAFDDVTDLLDSPSVDGVSICLPHHLHHQVAMAAIARRKHVLVEKPLAVTVAEGEEMVDAAEKAGVVLAASHNQIYYPAYEVMSQMIRGGQIGRPIFARLRLGMDPNMGGWRASTKFAGGGVLFDSGVHRLYLVREFLGPPTFVSAVIDVPRESGETIANVVLRFQSGAIAVIEANQNGPEGSFNDEVEVVGDDATLYSPGIEALNLGYRQGPPLRCYRNRAWATVDVPQDDWTGSVRKSIANFVHAVYNGTPPRVTGRDALDTLRLLHQIYDLASVVTEGNTS